MVRLGKTFACTVLAGAALLMPSLASSQATAPAPQANSASPKQPSTQAAPALGTTAQPRATAPSKPASGPAAARSHGRRSKAAPVAEAVPTPPPPPPTLEQSPPTAPRVNLQNGQLTIDAPNSTLAQILRAVQARTGASIDIPSSAGNERVVAQLGPGLPRDVLNTLLNGSKFDYVILGVTGDPGGIQKVILTPRQAVTAVNTAQNKNPQPAQDEDSGDEGSTVADTSDNEYQNPQPVPPPNGFRRPIMPGGARVNPGAESDNGEQQNGPKTPQQLMQEMQQMQQQQQMYQQQLNPANQQPAPQ